MSPSLPSRHAPLLRLFLLLLSPFYLPSASATNTPTPTPIPNTTTTAWLYVAPPFNPTPIYLARALATHSDRTTFALQAAAPAPGFEAYEATVTVAPTYFGQGMTLSGDAQASNPYFRGVVEGARLDCELATGAAWGEADAKCTASQGAVYEAVVQCGATYSQIGVPEPSDAQTEVTTTTTRPDWCTGDPRKGMSRDARRVFTAPRIAFTMARVVVTETRNQAVEGPVRTVGPVVVGVGLVAAAAALVG